MVVRLGLQWREIWRTGRLAGLLESRPGDRTMAKSQQQQQKRSREAAEKEAAEVVESEEEESSSDEEEEEEELKLDEQLEEEGLEDIDFDFDDPQERHFHAIRGMLRQSPVTSIANDVELSALADLLAGDGKSVGTVVGSGGGDELVGFAAAVQLAEYAPKADAGVDALVRAAAKVGAGGQRAVVVVHAFFVNCPPKVVAATFDLFQKDLAGLSYDEVLVLVTPSSETPAAAPAPPSKKAKKAKKKPGVACDKFEDDAFSQAAAARVDVGGGAALLRLTPDRYAAAVADIAAQAAR